MKPYKYGILGTCALGVGMVASANQVPEMNFDQKVKRSTLVVLGSVENLDCCSSGSSSGMERGIAHVQVVTYLKGRSAARIKVLYKTGIREFDPNCCEIGKRYLFLLTGEKDDIYRSVNGPYGIFEVGTP